jgi:hypothetical protein
MDVQVVRGFGALDGPFESVAELPVFVPSALPDTSVGWRIDARDSHAVVAINRLHQDGQRVVWADGAWFVPVAPRASTVLRDVTRAFGVPLTAVTGSGGAGGAPVRPVRIGLFDVFGGNMATGWQEWLLREFGFAAERVWGERVEAGDLAKDFDVLLFHTGLPGPRDLRRAARRIDEEQIPQLKDALPPFEDWSDLEARAVRLTGDKSLPALREFVRQGGTLIAFEGEVDKVVRHFGLPVKVGAHVESEDGESGETERATTRDEFYVPGSLLAIEVDTAHPIARGASPQLAAMVRRGSTVLEVTDPEAAIDVVARYRADDTLLSGWAIGTEFLRGKAAVLCAHVGKGRVVMFGVDATYRGQPLGTCKLVFQAILSAGEQR